MAKEIRFAVGNRENVRSSVWRVWANKNDLYLAARSSAGLSKISFHQSGICRFAIVSTTPRAPIKSWQRSKELKPGITPLFTIVVPAFTVEDGFQDKLPPANKTIVLLDPPATGTKLQIEILLTKSTFTEAEFRNLPDGDQVTFVGTTQLTHGTAWLIAHAKPFTDYEQGWVENLVQNTRINLTPVSSKDDITYSSLHSFEADLKPPAIVDIPMGRGNLHILPAS